MDRLWEAKPELRRLAPNFPFAAVSVNFGPQTVCWNHLDLLNLAFGWCVILVLGKFDTARGGHIILHEPKLILEVCHGDIVFIPSAGIKHGTIPVEVTESRYSVTWYTAAAIFQWVVAGNRTLESLGKKRGSKTTPGPDGLTDPERWLWGCSLFSTLRELRELWGNRAGSEDDMR